MSPWHAKGPYSGKLNLHPPGSFLEHERSPIFVLGFSLGEAIGDNIAENEAERAQEYGGSLKEGYKEGIISKNHKEKVGDI